MIDRAIHFASKAHEGMKRKSSGQPYIFHPIEVMSLVSLMTLDEDVLCAAVLHDAVEDAGVSLDEIAQIFNEKIAKYVSYETEDKRGNVNKPNTWVDRKKEAIEKMRNCDEIGAKMVCLADKVSNLRSFHLGLLDEGEDFWNNFNMKDPKMHYWYYESLKEVLSELKDYSVYKEFCFLIETIFNKYL